MKNTFLNITVAGLFAAVLVAGPATILAAEKTNSPAASEAGDSANKKKRDILPFNGKLTAVDNAAMTITVGERVFVISSETKITKDGKPATLADGVVGEKIGGAYKKSEDGKLNATSVRFGAKPEADNSEGAKKPKKKAPAGEAGANGAAE